MRGRKIYILVNIVFVGLVFLLSVIFLQDAGTLSDGLTKKNLSIISAPLWFEVVCVLFSLCFYFFSIRKTRSKLALRNGVDAYKVLKELKHGQMNWSDPIILTENYLISRRAGIHIIEYKNIKRLHTYTTTHYLIPVATEIMVDLKCGETEGILSICPLGIGRRRVKEIVQAINYKQVERSM